ncbi:MAG: hypothetical protein IKR04_05665 [Clostridia bacterium]|nr:hypothetical protein [Clostridia bacterium]
MKNQKVADALIYIFARTILQVICSSLGFIGLLMGSEPLIIGGLIGGVILYIILSIIPNLFIKTKEYGWVTLFNFISVIAYGILNFIVFLLVNLFYKSSELGLVVLVWVFALISVVAFNFFVNLIADLIACLVIKKKKV